MTDDDARGREVRAELLALLVPLEDRVRRLILELRGDLLWLSRADCQILRNKDPIRFAGVGNDDIRQMLFERADLRRVAEELLAEDSADD